jgi:hydroxyacylglutathione hydrolase
MINCKDGIHSYEEIAPKTYRIDEHGIANTYLLLGEKAALLIDSGLGVGNILASVQELTSLPITLALTHRHCDHAGGRDYFKEYYVHEGDKPLIYKILSSKFACKQLLKMNKAEGVVLSKKPYHSKVRYMDDQATFDLGGRVVRILHVVGHTQGSVVFLDETTHLMFTGDDVNPYLWMQLPGCSTLSEWIPGAEKILALSETYIPFCGHDVGKLSHEGIAQTVALVKRLLLEKPAITGKQLDYPLDKNATPRVVVGKKGLK